MADASYTVLKPRPPDSSQRAKICHKNNTKGICTENLGPTYIFDTPSQDIVKAETNDPPQKTGGAVFSALGAKKCCKKQHKRHVRLEEWRALDFAADWLRGRHERAETDAPSVVVFTTYPGPRRAENLGPYGSSWPEMRKMPAWPIFSTHAVCLGFYGARYGTCRLQRHIRDFELSYTNSSNAK